MGAREFWALRDISLSFSEGENIGLVGDNGAGKSTLLRVISDIYSPTAGSADVRGFVVPLLESVSGFRKS